MDRKCFGVSPPILCLRVLNRLGEEGGKAEETELGEEGREGKREPEAGVEELEGASRKAALMAWTLGLEGAPFFLRPVNERKKDHSDSNCTFSTSAGESTPSKILVSMYGSTCLSAARMRKTERI
jgi:hypothetical protein